MKLNGQKLDDNNQEFKHALEIVREINILDGEGRYG